MDTFLALFGFLLMAYTPLILYSDMESINKSMLEFSCDLFKALECSKHVNILFSPVSVAASMALLLLGSKGETASQIEKVLHIPGSTGTSRADVTWSSNACGKIASETDSVSEVHNQFKVLFEKLKSASDSELKIANGLFTQNDFPILKQYLTTAVALYQAQMKSVDYQKDKTIEDINAWVVSETEGKIKNLFDPNSVDKNTLLILINCVYFKGLWMRTFKKENTKNAEFYVEKDVKISVPMMSQTQTFNVGIAEELDAQILELPYGNGDMSMFIFLPNKMSGLRKVKQKLTSEVLMKYTDSKNLMKTRIEVHIPSFKLEEGYDLSQYLKHLGMVDAFSQQKADLSGISEAGLCVSQMVHKAFIEVNEEGTEAAAASGFVIIPKSLLPVRQFIADHPFLAFIKHNSSGTILFWVKVCSPNP